MLVVYFSPKYRLNLARAVTLFLDLLVSAFHKYDYKHNIRETGHVFVIS